MYRFFQHVLLAVEFAQLAARHQIGADAGRRIKRGQSRAARAATLDQNTLRHQFHFEGALVDLLLARGGRAGAHRERDDHFFNLLVLGKDLTARRAGVAQRIRHDGKVFRTLVAQRHDQRGRETMRHAKASDGHGGAVFNIR